MFRNVFRYPLIEDLSFNLSLNNNLIEWMVPLHCEFKIENLLSKLVTQTVN